MPPMDAIEAKPSQDYPMDDRLSIAELLDEEIDLDHESVIEKKVQHYKHVKYIRMVIFFLIWLCATTILFITEVEKTNYSRTVVPVAGKIWSLSKQPVSDELTLSLRTTFQAKFYDVVGGEYKHSYAAELADELPYKLHVNVQRTFQNKQGQQITEIVSKKLSYSLVNPSSFNQLSTVRIVREYIFKLKPSSSGGVYALELSLENVDQPLPLEIKTFPSAIRTPTSITLSALIFALLYVLFFWDVVSRGIVVMLITTLTVALTGLYHSRHELSALLQHVHLDTILLVFGLTLIVCIVAETGGDLYLAVQCYRLSNGHIWPMLTVMCLVTAFGAAFLDSTIILILIASLAIRLCEIMQLNPASVLTCLILFSNTGYMLTQMGLPEKVVLSQKGVIDYSTIFRGYGNFTLQMFLPVFLSLTATYLYLRLYYGNSARMRIIESPIVSRLRNGIRIWSRAAQTVSGLTKDEAALRQNMFSKVYRLRQRLRRLGKMPTPSDDFKQHLKQLQERHQIRDPVLLIKCCVVLLAVVIMQIAYSLQAHELQTGWICILFALILLALASWEDFDVLLLKIDWSTLITIAGLNIISHALRPLGLIESIGDRAMFMVRNVSQAHRLNTASIMILLVTTFCSIFIDTEHVSFVMTSRAYIIANNPDYQMELDPLLLAVFMGSAFGKNATLVSGISNIVCAGIAEKHGFKFYFWDFLKVGFIVTIANLLIGVIYLLLFILVLGY